jgi:hypothetical protein
MVLPIIARPAAGIFQLQYHIEPEATSPPRCKSQKRLPRSLRPAVWGINCDSGHVRERYDSATAQPMRMTASDSGVRAFRFEVRSAARTIECPLLLQLPQAAPAYPRRPCGMQVANSKASPLHKAGTGWLRMQSNANQSLLQIPCSWPENRDYSPTRACCADFARCYTAGINSLQLNSLVK